MHSTKESGKERIKNGERNIGDERRISEEWIWREVHIILDTFALGHQEE